MKYEVIPTSYFLRRLKQLKERGVERGVDSLALGLQEGIFPGVIIKGTKGKVRKTRIEAAGQGKRGGFRVIYYLCIEENKEIYLIDVYGKNEKETITPAEI
ncbi:MAG: hypothetical protein GXY50_02655 [Syntrophomonadaceae bacterium]|nr:hypothetical protein [Syntrophomonadaceae bacterium]